MKAEKKSRRFVEEGRNEDKYRCERRVRGSAPRCAKKNVDADFVHSILGKVFVKSEDLRDE